MVDRLNYSNLAQSTFSEPQGGIFSNTASNFERHNKDCCSSHISYHRWLSDKPHEINGIIACINGGFRDGYGWITDGLRGYAGPGLYLMMSVDEDNLDHWSTCGSQTKFILFLSSEI